MLAVHFRKTRMEIMLVMTNLTNNYAKPRKIYQSLHFASVYTPCCLLLRVVGSCCAKFETGPTFVGELLRLFARSFTHVLTPVQNFKLER